MSKRYGRLSAIMLMPNTAGGTGSTRLLAETPTALWLPPCATITRSPEQCIAAGCGYSDADGCYDAADLYDVLDSPLANSEAGNNEEESALAAVATAAAAYCKALTPWACSASKRCTVDFENVADGNDNSNHGKRASCVAAEMLHGGADSAGTTEDADSCECAEASPNDFSGNAIVRNKKTFCIASGCTFGKIKIQFGEMVGEGERCYNVTSAPDDRQRDNCADLMATVPLLNWNTMGAYAGCFSSSRSSGGGTEGALLSRCFAAQTLASRPASCPVVSTVASAPEYQQIACSPMFYCPAVTVTAGSGLAATRLQGLYLQSSPTPAGVSPTGPLPLQQWTMAGHAHRRGGGSESSTGDGDGGDAGMVGVVSFVVWPSTSVTQAMFIAGQLAEGVNAGSAAIAAELVHDPDAIAIGAAEAVAVPVSVHADGW